MRLEEVREIRRLHAPPARRRAMPLQVALIDPARHRRGSDLQHARDTLRPPIALGSNRSHETPNTAKTKSPLVGINTGGRGPGSWREQRRRRDKAAANA